MAGLPLNVPSHRQGDALLLMPYCGDGTGLENVGSYRYDQEVSTPYHYSVLLDDYGIAVRFVPQAKSGLFTMNFENKGARYVMVKTVGRGELQHEDMPLKEALRLANVSASFNLKNATSTGGAPTLVEIKKSIKKYYSK